MAQGCHSEGPWQHSPGVLPRASLALIPAGAHLCFGLTSLFLLTGALPHTHVAREFPASWLRTSFPPWAFPLEHNLSSFSFLQKLFWQDIRLFPPLLCLCPVGAFLPRHEDSPDLREFTLVSVSHGQT